MPAVVQKTPEANSFPALDARLRAAGPVALDDTEALQLISGASAGEVVTLLEEFGSLPEVLAAPRAALARHVSPDQSARLALVRDLARRLLERPLRTRSVLSGWAPVADYLRTVLQGLPREQFRVLFLDSGDRLIRDEVLGEGTVDHIAVYPREVMRRALELNAAAVVLVHNHPGGLDVPSPSDVESTRQVIEAGRALRIAVHDHYLVADQKVVSFRALGLP